MEDTMQKFIYGAGKYGKLLLHCLHGWGERIDYFVETGEPTVAKVDGIPVISFENMIKMGGRKVIFIAMQNNRIAREIQNNIYAAGGSDCKAYLCGNFINDNLLTKMRVHLEGERHCIICGNNFDAFLPAGIQEDIFNRHHIIGGGGIGKTAYVRIAGQ